MKSQVVQQILLSLGLTMIMSDHSIAEPWESDPSQHVLVDAKFRRWRAETPFGAYRPRTTRILSTLQGYDTAADQQLCEMGGRTDIILETTGFFRTEKVNGRWWLVDPHGHPFLATSLNSIRDGQRKGRNPTSVAAFASRWKDETSWATDATRFMRKNGFNTIGTWSDASLRAVDRPLPWTTVIYVMYPFGAQRGAKSDESNMKFPNECMPIFDPEFEAFCENKINSDISETLIKDESLIGYFVDNELPWRADALDRYLQIDRSDINYAETARWFSHRKQLKSLVGVENVTALIEDTDRDAFLAYIAERYFSIVSRYLRKRDPNHLYLGSRLHQVRVEQVFKIMGAYVDVVGVNYYNRWTPRGSEIDSWPDLSGDKPFLISEWYAKGEDSGYENVQGAGMVVKTQADRGRYYQNFLLRLLESKSCVGSFWHTYRDTKELPEGSNKGFLSVEFDPYDDLVSMAADINKQKYSLIDHFDR
jgi:hypothetical protein